MKGVGEAFAHGSHKELLDIGLSLGVGQVGGQTDHQTLAQLAGGSVLPAKRSLALSQRQAHCGACSAWMEEARRPGASMTADTVQGYRSTPGRTRDDQQDQAR